MILCGIQTNAMQNNAFQLVLPRFPLVQYFSTDFVMPDLHLPQATVANPWTDIPMAGDKPVFLPMSFNFLVNEDMSNYEEVYNWIHSIGFASSYPDYTNYQNKDMPHQQLGEQDAKVIFLSAKGNPLRTVTFYDAIPIALGGMTPFTTQDPSTQIVRASVTMAYSRWAFTD